MAERRITLVAALWLAQAAPVHGSQSSAVVTGSVTDLVSGDPVSAAAVVIDGVDRTVRTDSAGQFRVEVSAGPHIIQFRRTGYHARAFRFTLPSGRSGEVDLGAIVLEAIPPVPVRIVGRVTDANSGAPIVAAPIGLNGRPAAISDQRGRFDIRTVHAIAGELNRLTVRRIGYEALDHDVWFPAEDSLLSIDLAINPLAVELPEVVVEGDRVVIGGARLVGFNRRREAGFGEFLTERDIKRIKGQTIGDVLRRMSGVGVTEADGQTRVRVYGTDRRCSGPVIYIDGVRSHAQDVDFVVEPTQVIGIEVYRGGAHMPVEFVTNDRAGERGASDCGLVAFWTR